MFKIKVFIYKKTYISLVENNGRTKFILDRGSIPLYFHFPEEKKKEIILNPNRAFYLLLIRVEGWNTGIIPFYFHFVKKDDTNRT